MNVLNRAELAYQYRTQASLRAKMLASRTRLVRSTQRQNLMKLAVQVLVPVLVLAAGHPLPSSAAPVASGVTAAITKVLEDSAAAYSRGDFNGFIASYEKSGETTYVSGDKVIVGFDAISATYARRFRAAGASPGQLTLKILNVRRLDPEHAIAIGRFAVPTPSGNAPAATGIFSLVFHRTAAGWRIAADHTS